MFSLQHNQHLKPVYDSSLICDAIKSCQISTLYIVCTFFQAVFKIDLYLINFLMPRVLIIKITSNIFLLHGYCVEEIWKLKQSFHNKKKLCCFEIFTAECSHFLVSLKVGIAKEEKALFLRWKLYSKSVESDNFCIPVWIKTDKNTKIVDDWKLWLRSLIGKGWTIGLFLIQIGKQNT